MRVMFYLADKAENLSPECSFSDSSEGVVWRGKGRGRRYRSFCNKDQVVGTLKDYYWFKKIRYLVKEFNAFLTMGRCKRLGSQKSVLWCAPQLSGASILCFLILRLLRMLHCGVAEGADGWMAASCFYPEFPQGSHQGGCNVMAWGLQHPLFINMSGNSFFTDKLSVLYIS